MRDGIVCNLFIVCWDWLSMNSLLLLVEISNWPWVLNVDRLVRVSLHCQELLVLFVELLLLFKVQFMLDFKSPLMFHIFLILFVIFPLFFVLHLLMMHLGLLVVLSLNLLMAHVGCIVVLSDPVLGCFPLILKLSPNFRLELVHLVFHLSLNFLIDEVSNSLSHVWRNL